MITLAAGKRRMQKAYTVAFKITTKEAARGKAYYDKRVTVGQKNV